MCNCYEDTKSRITNRSGLQQLERAGVSNVVASVPSSKVLRKSTTTSQQTFSTYYTNLKARKEKHFKTLDYNGKQRSI